MSNARKDSKKDIEVFGSIVAWLDDRICQRIRKELAPCTISEYKALYIQIDPEGWAHACDEAGVLRAWYPGLDEALEEHERLHRKYGQVWNQKCDDLLHALKLVESRNKTSR
tara:strand:- start:627 stop:962 length:336 start_codon:yes stop_codon:yes gene_type:complete